MSIEAKILKLNTQLFPTGRAFKLPPGDLKNLLIALAQSETETYNDLVSIRDSLLPDNDNFSTDDATDWERRLGLPTNESLSLTTRKNAILRKLKDPGLNPAKQHYAYIQTQLQNAGFDVYVYENRFPDYPTGYITQTPSEFTGALGVQHGDFQHGDEQHGEPTFEFVANHVDQELDSNFVVPTNLKATFFIGGDPQGSYASVPTSRKDEFRHLILQLKPVQTIAYLIINYT